MPLWSNWSGRQQARPVAVPFLRSEADAQALVRDAAANGTSIRVAGAGHSHAPLVISDGIIADASGLAGVIGTDTAARRAWVWAGTPIYALGRPLHDAGLALKNQGDIDRQAIAGAVATGTHGSGPALQNLSAAVTGARVVLASGETVDCAADAHSDLWQVARLNLGALGVVTRLQLQLREAYKLVERGWSEPYEALLPKLADLIAANRHFEFFWYPYNDTAIAKAIQETDAQPVYPLAEEGARCAWNYEVLPNHRPHRHTEMEYSVPAGSGPECLGAIRELIRRDFPELQWPVEYRTVAADDVWLSMAYGRPTVTVSVHQDISVDEEPYFRACEEIFLSFEGRPHWGKVNYLDGAQLAVCHPRWRDWWAARDQVDPDQLFLNDYLRGVRPPR